MLWILIWAIGIAGLLYTVVGGIKLVAISDIGVGACLLLVGISLPYFGLKHLGQGDFSAGVHILFASQREHFNAIGTAQDAVPFSTLFTGMLLVNLNYWGMEQYIVQRTLASRNLAESLQVAFDAGAKRILLPMSSVTDIPSVPGELFAKFQTSFYSDPVDAVFKALGVE